MVPGELFWGVSLLTNYEPSDERAGGRSVAMLYIGRLSQLRLDVCLASGLDKKYGIEGLV